MAFKSVDDAAKSAGAMQPGTFRVVVSESDGRYTVRDYPDAKSAQAYADDAASETEDLPSPSAYIFDDRLECVDRGVHYSLRSPPQA